jgi:E3 ubiquitin-protein ligase BRE1
MQAEREAKPKPQKVRIEAGGSLGGADAAMLDMTLGMLRCSVCQDRFKGVCLTRCFHLFCKECVDEVIRTRSRKCPMCGEKFSDAEVRQIFFGSSG